MCGIVGVFHYRSGRAQAETVRRQAESLAHRGPDAQGVWCEGSVALGHRRLSIVDMSPRAHQPMSNEDGSLHLAFNGELYGWQPLARGLEQRGHVLRSASDAEIVLHLYEEHADAALRLLRGEFAFALYDGRRRRMLLVRDRMGVKPLYYHDDGSRIAFASELDTLKLDPSVPREIDERAIVEYLALRYVSAPRTIWKGVRMLAPAHVLVCDGGPPRVSPYWDFPCEARKPSSPGESTAMLRAKLEESVRLHQAADVPVGALLSGGIDSSAVVALMARTGSRPIQTFCAGFDELPFCERAPARRVAEHLGTEHHEVVVDAGAVDLLPQLAADLGEPLADASLLPTYVLSRMTRGHVKAVLSGDGGDEIFGGYSTYGAALRHSRLRWMPGGARRLLRACGTGLDPCSKLRRKLERIPLSVLERHVDAMASFSCSDLERTLSPELRRVASEQGPFTAWHEPYIKGARALGEVPALLSLDAQTYLPGDILRKVDCASMRCSLEVRVPLLDHEVVEFATSLPLSYKVRGGVSKWILKESVRDLLPPTVLTRGKKGFTVPLARWFTGRFGRLVRETLLDTRAARRGWTNQTEVERLVAQAGSGSPQGSTLHHLWSLVMLELWAQHHVDEPRFGRNGSGNRTAVTSSR